MAETNFPQPPRSSERNFDDWLFRFWKYVTEGTGGASGGSTSAETATPTAHSSLSGLNTSEYTHLSAINAGDLTDGGDSNLHFHSADRSRENHSGTQSSSTISDFDSAVQASLSQRNPVLEAQVFRPHVQPYHPDEAQQILRGQVFGS